jgi:hypothetical protein
MAQVAEHLPSMFKPLVSIPVLGGGGKTYVVIIPAITICVNITVDGRLGPEKDQREI